MAEWHGRGRREGIVSGSLWRVFYQDISDPPFPPDLASMAFPSPVDDTSILPAFTLESLDNTRCITSPLGSAWRTFLNPAPSHQHHCSQVRESRFLTTPGCSPCFHPGSFFPTQPPS